MNETTYYEFPVYEPNDSPSLMDGYNAAAIKADITIHKLENRIKVLETKVKVLEGSNSEKN